MILLCYDTCYWGAPFPQTPYGMFRCLKWILNYLQHIEQTGREQSSREVGLMDSNSNINSNTTTPATAMMNNNNNESKRSSAFGRNVNQGVEFNEEQVNQLDKLKEEAVKAGGKKGGGGNGGDVIVDRYDGR